jgi:nucleotide-binding universal stress UspA family protein
MTIIAGFSSSRQGSAPLNLAAQFAHTTGEKIIAAVVVERALPPGADPIEDEYRGFLASRAGASLERVVGQMRGDLDITVTIHHSTSIPNGLMELAAQHSADVVVVGSSSSGLLGRVTLGSVTERLVHTSKVPVALAPRGYPSSPVPVQRLTAAYGGGADAVGLIATSAELAKRWKVRLRIASFTVPPLTMFGGSIESVPPRSSSFSSGRARPWTRQYSS